MQIKKIVKKIPGAVSVKKMLVHHDFSNYNMPQIRQIPFEFVETDTAHINLLITTMNKNEVFAGVATAVNFFSNLSEYMGIKKRIICMNSPLDEKNIYNPDVFKYSNVFNLNDENFVIDNTQRDKVVKVGKNDIFVATYWTTAYSINELSNAFLKKFNKPLNLVYLIQDYEPGFYAWSTEYLLAESTYKMNANTVAVFNSFLLKDHFKNLGYKFAHEFAFTPKLNTDLKKYLLENKNKFIRKKQILLYGRPGTPRNAFTLILMALEQWYMNDPEAGKWTIYSAGQEFPEIKNKSGLRICSLGKLTLEEYAKTMLETSVGISLMVSPHPSYPPLEMSTFGVKVITNCFSNKDLSTFNSNIISLECCNVQNLAKALRDTIRSCDDNQVVINDYLDSNDEQWNNIYKQITDIFLD